MKTFRSKFFALALTVGVLGTITSIASPVQAFDVTACEEKLASYSHPQGLTQTFPTGQFYNSMQVWTVTRSCSNISGGEVNAFVEGTKGPYFPLTRNEVRGVTVENGVIVTQTEFWIDGDALGLKVGTYRFVGSQFRDESGRETPTYEGTYTNGKIVTVDFRPTRTTAPGTTTPPRLNRPEVLDDLLVSRVWGTKGASVYYTATVRCSPSCGTLPENFAAKLCEVGTSYMSSTCIASTRPFQIGKAKKTKLGVVNTFAGTFIIGKKTTGKKYQVYLNIPAGKKQPTTLGLDTFIWNGKSTFKNLPSSIVVPTTNTAPGTTTTTIAGTSPSTTSNVASSAALTVTSDSISGKSSLTVKGSGAAVTIDTTIKCSGQCTKLPASILGRLCKVGTSYTDASCTSIITLYPATGATATSATFRGNTMFGTSPTGAVYQPFFSMTATGISGTTRLSGTSRVTWTK